MTVHAPHPLPFRSPRLRAKRHALLIGCALGGALSLAPGRADAQAFDGTPTVGFFNGNVGFDRTTPGVETITVNSDTAIIDWRPTGTTDPLVFLPAGNTATFVNGPTNTNFAVLNRINTATLVRFDGTVISQLRDASGAVSRGGTVLFASPGGIIVGPTAVFDVGSLVLTTLSVAEDGYGNFFDPSGALQFGGGAGAPNATITTQAGSQISALNEGSYVAIVAPVVVHRGSVRVNGAAAYIAGEEVEMRVNQGLFDIVVATGSDNPIPIIHSGSTGGPASTGSADVHRIYMVAVPKNQTISALVAGNVGFDAASVATVENGAIILSAGFNVLNGAVDRYGALDNSAPVPGLDANIQTVGGTFSSDVFGYAVTALIATGNGLLFRQDVSLYAGLTASLFAGEGETVTVEGNALVSADRFNSADSDVIDLTGGTALLRAAQDGTLRILGNATVDASAQGLVDGDNVAGSGTGGNVQAVTNDGLIRIDGNLVMVATGAGGIGSSGGSSNGGAGTGGNATIGASSTGAIQVVGTTGINVSGAGSLSSGGEGVPGAAGQGGVILVQATSGGAVTLTGAATATTDGRGGFVGGGIGLEGGAGFGGTITVTSDGGALTFAAAATMSASGFGGEGPTGGAGEGGAITVEARSATITFSGTTGLQSNGFGGDAGPRGNGGGGLGGDVQIRARSDTAASRITGAAVDILARGVGGEGGIGSASTGAGAGGDGTGADILILAEAANGILELGLVTANSNGVGGAGGASGPGGGAGGTGTGGNIQAGVERGPNTATTIAGSARFGGLDFSASGVGGPSPVGIAGNATGGNVTISAIGAPVEISGATSLLANALAGVGVTPGVADGGVLIISAGRYTTLLPGGRLTAGMVIGSADAIGDSATGNTNGEWIVATDTADMTFAGLTLTANASGAPTVRPYSRITASNGVITTTGAASLSSLGEIRVEANGTGRIAGGALRIAAGDSVVVRHTGAPAGGFTIDVASLDVSAGDGPLNPLATEGENFDAGAGVVTRATDDTSIRAIDNAIIAGRITGAQILIGSADIDIQATGGIGDATTQLAALDVGGGSSIPVPIAAGPATVIGGAAAGPGYTLTDAEANRIRAATLRILAPPRGTTAARTPDLVMRDLSLSGANVGTLEVRVGGDRYGGDGTLAVEGAVLLANASATGGINLRADERVQIATPTGSLRVRDAAGLPGGSLVIRSRNIWAASQAIVDRLRADPDYATRNAELLDNGGTEAPRGYIEAADVTFQVRDTLYVQNSGTADSFAGITVVQNTLTITPDGTAPLSVYAFGRRINPNGSFVTNNDFFAEVAFNTNGGTLAASYRPDAAFNACVIVTGVCPARAPDGPGPGGPGGPGGPDPITGPTGGSDTILLPPDADDDDLVDTSFADDPLIEEPVTSGGESSLWSDPDLDCDRDNDGDCDEGER